MNTTETKTTLIRGGSGAIDWGLERSADLTASTKLISMVAANPELGRIVRIYRPAPTVAFSGLERRLPGFQDAVGEAAAFAFEPVIRPAGGRMVAVDQDWVILDIITPELEKTFSHREVYLEFGEVLVNVLRELGIDANLGPVAGEYCPGDYSINARGKIKLVGTAQRVQRGARLFSACIPISISYSVAALFERVNAELGLDWNPETLGGLDEEAPQITADALEDKLIEAFAPEVDGFESLTDVYQFNRELVLQG
jgi:lipoate-protein ligase A